MPAELAERLIGECLCGADGWRDSLRCANAEWCASGNTGGNIHIPATLPTLPHRGSVLCVLCVACACVLPRATVVAVLSGSGL